MLKKRLEFATLSDEDSAKAVVFETFSELKSREKNFQIGFQLILSLQMKLNKYNDEVPAILNFPEFSKLEEGRVPVFD